MHKPLTRALFLAAATLTVISLTGQTTEIKQAPAISVSIGLKKNKIPVGQSPWVNLRVENLTDREITIVQDRPHVEGKEGELPMKPGADIITDSSQPRIARLKRVVYVPWTIPPKDASIHTYQLMHFFDLSHPGQYTVYMEVADPNTQKMVRTNRARFEIELQAH
jgi:hypothetical protein